MQNGEDGVGLTQFSIFSKVLHNFDPNASYKMRFTCGVMNKQLVITCAYSTLMIPFERSLFKLSKTPKIVEIECTLWQLKESSNH